MAKRLSALGIATLCMCPDEEAIGQYLAAECFIAAKRKVGIPVSGLANEQTWLADITHSVDFVPDECDELPELGHRRKP